MVPTQTRPCSPARACWLGEPGHELSIIAPQGLAWQPCPDALARDLSPWGAWYVKHTQGYDDALTAFLHSAESTAFLEQPWQVGRVPCLLLFPNGSFAMAPDAAAQPIVLPMRETNDAKELRSHLDDLTLERTWPGSL